MDELIFFKSLTMLLRMGSHGRGGEGNGRKEVAGDFAPKSTLVKTSLGGLESILTVLRFSNTLADLDRINTRGTFLFLAL